MAFPTGVNAQVTDLVDSQAEDDGSKPQVTDDSAADKGFNDQITD